MLTNQTLIDFNEWLGYEEDWTWFDLLEFFDDHGVIITIDHLEGFFYYLVNDTHTDGIYYTERLESVLNAFKKANKIYNEKHQEKWN